MIYGIIDVGSNSIRLLLSDGVSKIQDKIVKRTQLAEKLAITGILCEEAMQRTIPVIKELYDYAIKNNADKVYVFATESVRKAKNKQEFLDRLKNIGIIVDVIPKEMEAQIGFRGAYFGGKVCVMDIGGASTELAVGDEKGIEYSKSAAIGIVRLKDLCGEKFNKIKKYVNEIQKEYGIIPKFDELIAIGGTASSYVAIELGLDKFESEKVDFFKLKYEQIERIVNLIHSTKIEDRVKIKGMDPSRTDVLVCGGYLLLLMMKMLNKDYVIVRESDNQEGYLKYKLEQK